MKYYIVIMRDPTQETLIVMTFAADDWNHAAEQAINAEPEHEIVSITLAG